MAIVLSVFSFCLFIQCYFEKYRLYILYTRMTIRIVEKEEMMKNIEELTVKFMFRNICDEICTVLMYIIFEYDLKMCVILFYAKELKIEQKSIFSMKYTFDKQKTTETICIYLAWFYSGH